MPKPPAPSAPPPVSAPPPKGTAGIVVGVLLCVALVAVAVGSWLWGQKPRITEETVQTAVMTAIQRESPDQFLVVGTLDISSDAEARSTTNFLPGLLDLNIGQTTARVHVPGRASYGFNLRTLRPSDIRYTPEGVVVVTLPPLTVFSAEPILEQAEIEVDARRWQRLSREPERAAVREALGRIRPALRRQAEAHLTDSAVPKENAARAVQQMIETPLQAAGVRDARFRFIVAPGDTLDGTRGDR